MLLQIRFKAFLVVLAAIVSFAVENIYALNGDCESQAKLTPGFSGIPEDRQQVILETIAQVGAIASPHLKMPGNLSFQVAANDEHFGFARYQWGVVELPPIAMKISVHALRTLVAHEFTHFIVFQNLRGLYAESELTLSEILNKFGEDSDFTQRSVTPHLPMAEMLCDVMAVLVAHDPQALTKLIAEMIELAPPSLKEKTEREFQNPLARRDFSVSAWDPRWKEFETDDVIYARYNQIRAHLWESHMRNLPHGLRGDFFSRLFGAIEQFYKASDNLERAYAGAGLVSVNPQVMALLDNLLWGPQTSQR